MERCNITFYIIVCHCHCYCLFAGIGNPVLTPLSVVVILSVWKDRMEGLANFDFNIVIVTNIDIDGKPQ